MLPTLRIEKRLYESKTARIIVPILSLAFALLLGSMLLWSVGANPGDTYVAMFAGALGGRYAFSETLLKATPIILCALGVSIAFRMLFWNIGAEGQLAMGGFAAAGVALFVPTNYPDLPVWIALLLAFLAAFLAGAVWILVPALLKAFFKVNEIITTLMLNYVAVLWIEYLFYGPWKDPKGYGFPGSAQFIKEMWLGRIQHGWVQPAIVLLIGGVLLSLGLSLLAAPVARRQAWLGLISGAITVMLGWLAAPYLSELAIVVTTFLTQGWLLPEGAGQAATVALLWLTLSLSLLMVSVARRGLAALQQSHYTGIVNFAVATFLGGMAAGQVVLLIVLLAGTRVHVGFLIGLAAAAFIWLVLGRTKWGYEIRVIGENPRAAMYAGVNLARNIILVAILSGGLAGLAGFSEVLGVSHRLQKGLTVGYGYTAILVAWLAGLNPWGIIIWGILWAALLVGGDQIQISMNLPAAMAPSLQGLIVFCVLGGQFLITHRLRLVWPESGDWASARTASLSSATSVDGEGDIET